MEECGNKIHRKNCEDMEVYKAFEYEPNCNHMLMLLHFTAWMMKQIIFLLYEEKML